MKNLKSILSFLLDAIYLLALIALILSYFAPVANPKSFWIIAFFGLAFPWLLLINLFFLIWWIIRWKKFYWLSLIVILAGWNHIRLLIHFGEKKQNETKGLKVLSFNVRSFDLYNWTNNRETKKKIFDFFKKESPDILCLQEFFQGDSGYFETIDSVMLMSGLKEYHINYTVSRHKIHHWGIATFSKYPIVFKGEVPFKYKSNNICIFSDIKIDNDTVRVYNMHLQSIRFDHSDYRFIEALKKNNDTLDAEYVEVASKNILRRLKRAFIKRTTQAEKILAHIYACKYPVVICGDFNDTPFSYTYNLFSKKHTDAFMESGNGMGVTYTGIMPSYRIDYIFYSPDFTSSYFMVHPEELSDHHPISAIIRKREK